MRRPVTTYFCPEVSSGGRGLAAPRLATGAASRCGRLIRFEVELRGAVEAVEAATVRVAPAIDISVTPEPAIGFERTGARSENVPVARVLRFYAPAIGGLRSSLSADPFGSAVAPLFPDALAYATPKEASPRYREAGPAGAEAAR